MRIPLLPIPSARTVASIRAAVYLGLAALCVALVALGYADADGRWFAGGLATLFGVLGLLALRRARAASPVRPAFPDPSRLPAPAASAILRRNLLLLSVALPLLSAMSAWELNGLAHGASDAMLWAPVGLVYDHFGYWPAVLFPLTLWLVAAVILGWKIVKLRGRANG